MTLQKSFQVRSQPKKLLQANDIEEMHGDDTNLIRLGVFGYSNIQPIETLMNEVTLKSSSFYPFVRKAVSIWDGTVYIDNKWVGFAEDGELCVNMLNYKKFTRSDVIDIFTETFQPSKYKESFNEADPRPFDVAWCIVKFLKLMKARSGKPLDPFMQQRMKSLIEDVKTDCEIWHIAEIDQIFKSGVIKNTIFKDYMEDYMESKRLNDMDVIGRRLQSTYDEILSIEKMCDD